MATSNLVLLYANEVIKGNRTIEAVPTYFRSQVAEYLETIGK